MKTLPVDWIPAPFWIVYSNSAGSPASPVDTKVIAVPTRLTAPLTGLWTEMTVRPVPTSFARRLAAVIGSVSPCWTVRESETAITEGAASTSNDTVTSTWVFGSLPAWTRYTKLAGPTPDAVNTTLAPTMLTAPFTAFLTPTMTSSE